MRVCSVACNVGAQRQLDPRTKAPGAPILLYDWDNTLVDAWAGITSALNAAFRRSGSRFGPPRTPATACAFQCARAFR